LKPIFQGLQRICQPINDALSAIAGTANASVDKTSTVQRNRLDHVGGLVSNE
jgi:hypothetical protein